MMGLDLNDMTPSPQSSYNSSFGSESGRKLMNSSNNSITALVPGGVVTTQNISTVIRPKGNNNSLQFVKIQTPELSKKAVEQIKLAEDSKISKEKIKEVEEDWQNNLLNWKSKRRQQFNFSTDTEPNNPFDTSVDSNGGRKIKTFAEMIEQRARSGNRLGFHLQRYIGADDEDDQAPTTEDNTKDCTDGEADGRTEVEETQETEPEEEREVVKEKQEIKQQQQQLQQLRQQEEETKPEQDERDELEREQEESEEEEEDEQDEEQKHLQRIAFEAKLKAFERLTKPTPPPAPKFMPNRINRNSVTPTRRPELDIAPRERKQLHQPPPLPQQKQPPQHQKQQQQPPPQHQNQQQQQRQHQLQQQQQQQLQHQQPQPQPKPQIPIPPKIVESSHPKLNETSHYPRTKEQQPSPSSETLTTPTKPMVRDEDRLQSTPNKSASVSSIQIDKSLSQISIDNSVQRVQDSFKQVNIVQKPAPQPPPEPPAKNVTPMQNNSNITTTTTNNNNSSNNNNNTIIAGNKSLNTPSQRRLTRGDKDRTVLSVSGKKRCSSCKEELGRGAAAFVVESLCLVYHTNCFRCSVCHVNLSNGFQGVDVRVHAGALHCQNCYSKDGLNYSRV